MATKKPAAAPVTIEHIRLIAETLLAISAGQQGTAKDTAEELLALVAE